jgi:hypothetical protein
VFLEDKMKLLREWVEVLECCDVGRQQFQLCATAAAYHDEMSNQLVVYRDAFLREPVSYGPDEYAYPPWLPDADSVHLICSAAAAAELAEQEFNSWSTLLRNRMEGRDRNQMPEPSQEDTTFEREVWDVLVV